MSESTVLTASVQTTPAELSCDRVYRSMVQAALAGDHAALAACSDYRQERGLLPLFQDRPFAERTRLFRCDPLFTAAYARHHELVRQESRVKKATRKREQSRRAKALRPVRDAVGYSCYPIEIVDGDAAPELVGRSYHWVNRSGDEIRFPNAYNRKAFSSPAIYVGSTLRIEVGREWLRANGIEWDGE